jgi:tRNA-uridine 2-sulfurtransferase
MRGHDSGETRTLAVGLSGGVDSSVAAYLLVKEWDRPEAGRNMVGVSHFIWPDSKSCNDETLSRAEKVCGKLGIPYKRIDMVDEFTRQVVDDFVDTYLAGKTPNPCVRCNERVRFGSFYKRLAGELFGSGAASRLFFATGHYVRTIQRNGRWFLRRGIDPGKDQSYMLYKIDRKLLPYLRFPLGDYTKREVVEIALAAGLPSASVKESQDICFIRGNYPDFIRGYAAAVRAPDEAGTITDTAGRVLGTHRGYIHYTIGQRKGLGLSDGPWYVANIDAESNTVVVGRSEECAVSTFTIAEPNWFIRPPQEPLSCSVKIRYNTPDAPCTVRLLPGAAGAASAEVTLENPAALTPGQSAVFYDGDIVLGGGIILR